MRETGECLPDAPGLTRLARVFDVDPEWLLDDTASGEPKPRTARRVKLAWFDWVMLALAAASLVAMLCGLNMETVDRVYHATIQHPNWTWLVLFVHYFVWTSAGWSVVALIYRFLACPMPPKRSIKCAFIILGVAVIAVYLVSILLTWGQIMMLIPNLDLSLWIYLRIIEHPEFCAIPGILFSNCVKRKEKQPAAR